MILPRWALAAWSHCCCRCGANLLMFHGRTAGPLLAMNVTTLSLQSLASYGCMIEPSVQLWQLWCQGPHA